MRPILWHVALDPPTMVILELPGWRLTTVRIRTPVSTREEAERAAVAELDWAITPPQQRGKTDAETRPQQRPTDAQDGQESGEAPPE